jgi:uncharacterized SAM-binding protein YcdF (DUF218 family)
MSWQLVLSPLSWAIALFLLLVVVWRRLPRAPRYVAIVIEVLVVLSMTPLGANLLVRAVEARVPPARHCAPPVPTTIVLLSGGFDRPPESVVDFSAVNAESLHRLFAAVDLWRRLPGSTLVIAGGGEGNISQAALLARLAQRLGVVPGSIRVEPDSQTTWQNARNVAAMSPPLPRRIWLVSSALHLPRATGAFRHFGFDPCAWSSGSLYLPPGGPGYFIPQSSALEKAEFAIHEIVGGWIYALKAHNAAATANVNNGRPASGE